MPLRQRFVTATLVVAFMLLTTAGAMAQAPTPSAPQSLTERQERTLQQLEAVRGSHASLEREVDSLNQQIRELRTQLATLPELITASARTRDEQQAQVDAAITQFKEATGNSGEFVQCLTRQGLSVDSVADTSSYGSMSEADIAARVKKIAQCGSDKICPPGDEDCKKKVDKAMQRLAKLLQLVGMMLSIAGYPEIGIPMMAMAGSLAAGGDGDGDGDGDNDGVEASTGGSSNQSCGSLCRGMEGLNATLNGKVLTLTWMDGQRESFDLAKVEGAPQPGDVVKAETSTRTLLLERCSRPKTAQEWGGVIQHRLKNVNGSTTMKPTEFALKEGQGC